MNCLFKCATHPVGRASWMVMLGLAVWLGPVAANDRLYQEERWLTADLDRDGRPDTVRYVRAPKNAADACYMLEVVDARGKTLWKSPTVSEGPFYFACPDPFFGAPELLADLDGDGTIELVHTDFAHEPGPSLMRIFRWTGGAFEHLRTGSLMEKGEGSGVYTWEVAERDSGRWIETFESVATGGTFRVEVLDYTRGEFSHGRAVVKPIQKGFQVVRWIRPISAVRTDEQQEAFTKERERAWFIPDDPPSPDGASDPGVRYRARLSRRDHVNSSGVKLDSALAILQQDRANVYRFDRADPEDEKDPVFGDAAARAGILKRSLVCTQGEDGIARIVKGAPVVEVVIEPTRLTVSIVEP